MRERLAESITAVCSFYVGTAPTIMHSDYRRLSHAVKLCCYLFIKGRFDTNLAFMRS